ncbi:VOC family protein [Listeria costaricensis]|uniref:VOC family protein n=1 Tax=Listeria costaricensis TaxID=2026604 RepID=UPI000C0747E0|nr:VOC family protein [Listeria costaricensis]
MQKATPFLMFQNATAEPAAEFYISLFDDAEILQLARYGANQPGPEGTIMIGAIRIKNLEIAISDSFVKHAFDFTPSSSIFINCDDTTEFDRYFEGLSKKGEVLMEPANYGFSEKFAWVNDQFGVSWQISL